MFPPGDTFEFKLYGVFSWRILLTLMNHFGDFAVEKDPFYVEFSWLKQEKGEREERIPPGSSRATWDRKLILSLGCRPCFPSSPLQPRSV